MSHSSSANIFRIKGGVPLHGTIRASGNKNAALPMIAASLLTAEEVILDNLPDIGDVHSMLAIAAALGARVREGDDGSVSITADTIVTDELPAEYCDRVRAGVLFAAPLLHRRGRARMVPPGGDVIGRRRLDPHLSGFAAMGCDYSVNRELEFTAVGALSGADIFMAEASVTATEQLICAAALADGETRLSNAACEPHVQDLCELLVKMGASIRGIGTNTLIIEGVKTLHGARHRISSDYTEAGSYLAIAAATGGGITVNDIDHRHYRMIQHTFGCLGVDLTFADNAVSLTGGQSRQIRRDASGCIPVFDDGPWPHFPSDLMSVSIVMATQLEGTVLFFEKMFESRMYFVDRLISMGANAVICDPHRVLVTGPARLHALDLSSPDIRAGIALLGAALCAEGVSTVNNVHHIDRGYARVEEKFTLLGAEIERM
ncbi:MAG: UDP-N-acetylglucosamine 1-carboxyvinyltransferase [Lentisphaeria bacterium]|nr:UDP-N-acetylglucosamine 1-carboxyvinyltransferase [Lentisphaeria bacterium]